MEGDWGMVDRRRAGLGRGGGANGIGAVLVVGVVPGVFLNSLGGCLRKVFRVG